MGFFKLETEVPKHYSQKKKKKKFPNIGWTMTMVHGCKYIALKSTFLNAIVEGQVFEF